MAAQIRHYIRTATRYAEKIGRAIRRLARRSSLKLAITVALPPFLKVTLTYTAVPKPANDNRPVRRRRAA